MEFGWLEARFEGLLPGAVVVELLRLEVVERSLALASKLCYLPKLCYFPK